LSTDFGIKNVRQDCKICIVWMGNCGRRRVNGGDEGEGIWLTGFIDIYELE
jgi:hypothetical protein